VDLLLNKLLRRTLVNVRGGVVHRDVYNRNIDDPYRNRSTRYFQDHIVLFLLAQRETQ